MSPRPSGALSRWAERVIGSRFCKPIARAVLVVMGLGLLAVVGQTSIASTSAAPPFPTSSVLDASSDLPLPGVGPPPTASASSTPTASPSTAHGPPSADDPVFLNTADENELRRLPGIGAKRAAAIVALRTRLGRFRAVEDLLKVKGIGRAMLKRLRPLVRLDGALVDASAPVR